MNCFLFIFMITLTVATSNPVYDLSYKEIVDLVNSCNSLKEENEKFKDTITQIQMLISALSTSASTTPEPITPGSTTSESTTPEPTTPEPKLSDEDRVRNCVSSTNYESITASSIYINISGYGPQHSRLNSVSGNGGWLAWPYKGSWIELDMGTKKTVKGVATQGQDGVNWYVKSYSIEFKTSTSSSFHNVEDQFGGRKIFHGNTDHNTVVINDVDVEARIIRIYPLTWEGGPVLRFDVLFC